MQGKITVKPFASVSSTLVGSPVSWTRLACVCALPNGIILGTTTWITKAKGSGQGLWQAKDRGKRNNRAGEREMHEKATAGEVRRKLGEAQGWLSARPKHLGYAGGCLPFLSPCPHVRRGPVHPPGRGKLKPALPTRAKKSRNEAVGTEKRGAGDQAASPARREGARQPCGYRRARNPH